MRMGNTVIKYLIENKRSSKLFDCAVSNNTPSLRFHEPLGFLKEGTLKNHFFHKGNYYDVIL